MIPPSLKYSAEGSTPAFTDHAEQIVERGAQVRLRIKGIRGEIGSMYAIGTIYEDYLGQVLSLIGAVHELTSIKSAASIAVNNCRGLDNLLLPGRILVIATYLKFASHCARLHSAALGSQKGIHSHITRYPSMKRSEFVPCAY